MFKIFSSVQECALFAITLLWGASFILIRLAMQECGPLCFVGLRFSVATGVILLLALPVLRGITRKEIFGGILIGISVFGGFAMQTYGLVQIESAKSAFITAFYVPLVPVLEMLLMRHRLGWTSWLGIGL